MDAKDELLKDFEQDVYEAYSIWASRACDGNGAEGAFKTIAAHLAARGYRKVTTCEKCKHLTEHRIGYPSLGVAIGIAALGRYKCNKCGYQRKDGFCSQGVPKEGKPDAGL